MDNIVIDSLNYRKINSSFDKKLVFRLGFDAGFYSEFNMMILAAVYALKNDLKFEINSTFANFRLKDGWNDYFVPFFPESRKSFNKSYNYRPYGVTANSKVDCFIKTLFNIEFFTQDVWHKLRDKQFWEEEVKILNGKFELSFLETCSTVVQMCYQFNPTVEGMIQERNQKITLPIHYVGIHIRRGDKINETSLFSLNLYFKRAESITDIRAAYISTDDVNIIKIIAKNHPNWQIFHRSGLKMDGYNQEKFSLKSGQDKFESLVDLFADVRILTEATIFLGTATTNVGMFIGMKRGDKNCFYLDSEKWRVA